MTQLRKFSLLPVNLKSQLPLRNQETQDWAILTYETANLDTQTGKPAAVHCRPPPRTANLCFFLCPTTDYRPHLPDRRPCSPPCAPIWFVPRLGKWKPSLLWIIISDHESESHSLLSWMIGVDFIVFPRDSTAFGLAKGKGKVLREKRTAGLRNTISHLTFTVSLGEHNFFSLFYFSLPAAGFWLGGFAFFFFLTKYLLWHF
jgi:hypothetical protein